MWWLMEDIISYENKVMLAAILCLLLVIVFILLLHIYARWFLHQQARHSHGSITLAQVPFHTTTYVTSLPAGLANGIDPRVLNSLPMFVYQEPDGGQEKKPIAVECAICLSVFEEREVRRSLPRCSHGFHVQCIDMWLQSQSTCPVCRAQVVVEADKVDQRRDVKATTGDSDHNQTVEVNDNQRRNLMASILVENHDDDRRSESPTSDWSPRRMLSSSSRSQNRVHPSYFGTSMQV